MHVKPNIGILNALLRITCGLTILACTTAKMVKKPWRESYYLFAFLGAMKVAEGIVRFCPVTYLFQKNEAISEFFNKVCGNEQSHEMSHKTGETGGENPA